MKYNFNSRGPGNGRNPFKNWISKILKECADHFAQTPGSQIGKGTRSCILVLSAALVGVASIQYAWHAIGSYLTKEEQTKPTGSDSTHVETRHPLKELGFRN